MRTRLIGVTTALAAMAVTAGCGLTGSEPSEPSQKSGQVTVGDKTRQTQSIKCTQVERLLTIAAKADPGGARVLLQLGGERPLADVFLAGEAAAAVVGAVAFAPSLASAAKTRV